MSAPMLNSRLLVVRFGGLDGALALRDHRLRQLDPFGIAAGSRRQHQQVADLDERDRVCLDRIPLIVVRRRLLEGAFLGV